MTEIKAADRRCRPHGVVLGELHAGARLRIQKPEKSGFFAVIRLCRITGRGPDTAIGFGDQLLIGKVFNRRIAPQFTAYGAMQIFGECLGQAVGKALNRMAL